MTIGRYENGAYRPTLVHRIQAVSRSDEGPALGRNDNAVLKCQLASPLPPDPGRIQIRWWTCAWTRRQRSPEVSTSLSVSEVRWTLSVSRSDGGSAPGPNHDASLKCQPHQPCEGLINNDQFDF
ncbi:hypothetical protein PO909_000158 [Leuciscus waleckii]